MKRVCALIGFTTALTLIVLNIVCFKYSFVSYIVLFLAAALFLASLLFKRIRKGAAVSVALGSILFASFIFATAYSATYLPQKALDSQVCDVRLKIISAVEETDNGYTCTAKVEKLARNNAPQGIKVKLNTTADLGIAPYTDFDAVVQFFCIADNSFDSYGYFGDNIFLTARIMKAEKVYDTEKTLGYHLINIKQSIVKILENGFDDKTLGIACGILLGDKSYMADEASQSLQICGISHIVAVSGLHITVICSCLYSLLRLFNSSNGVSVAVSLIVLFVYSGVVGFPKSVLRAGIMLSVMLISRLFNYKGDSLNSLGIAVFFLCLNPFAVSDTSALLTVTAVLGIILITPRLDELVNAKIKNKAVRYFTGSINVSLGVMLATMPVMWLAFGKISFLSLFLNILVIPLVDVGLVSCALYALFFGIPFLRFTPLHIARFAIGAVINISEFFSSRFSFLFVNMENELYGVAISAVFVFIGISLLLFKKIKINQALVFMCAVFAVCISLNAYQLNNNAYFYISPSKMVIAYDKDNCVAFGISNESDFYDYSQYERKNNYFIDCKYRECKNKNIITSDSVISNSISVDFEGDCVIVNVYGNLFKIKEDCVIINNNLFYRNLEDRFSSQDSVTIVVAGNNYCKISN